MAILSIYRQLVKKAQFWLVDTVVTSSPPPAQASMNALLAFLADTVPNPTVLVLDGSSCNSVRCVTGGIHHDPETHHIIAFISA